MVVVGGRSSANTKELTRLCEIAGTRAPDRERPRPDDAAPFEGAQVVGVTGGTSTPIEDLRDVAERILVHRGHARGARARRRARPRRPRPRRNARRPHDLPADLDRAPRRSAPPDPWPAQPAPRPARRRLRRPPERRQEHAVQPHRRRARGDRRGPRPHDARPPVRRRRVERPAVRRRRHRRPRARPGRPDRGAVQDQARLAIAEADVIVFVVDATTGPTPADLEAAALLRRTTTPVLVAVNKADNEQRELEARRVLRPRLGGHVRDLREPRARRRRPARRRSSGRCRPRPRRSSRARRAKPRPRRGRDEIAAGRLEPFVVGDAEADDADDADGDGGADATASTPRRAQAGTP